MRPGYWYGTWAYLVSDRGTHFTADIIRELMVLVCTNHVLTVAASKQENAAVENAKRSIYVACYLITVFWNGGPMCYR